MVILVLKIEVPNAVVGYYYIVQTEKSCHQFHYLQTQYLSLNITPQRRLMGQSSARSFVSSLLQDICSGTKGQTINKHCGNTVDHCELCWKYSWPFTPRSTKVDVWYYLSTCLVLGGIKVSALKVAERISFN